MSAIFNSFNHSWLYFFFIFPFCFPFASYSFACYALASSFAKLKGKKKKKKMLSCSFLDEMNWCHLLFAWFPFTRISRALCKWLLLFITFNRSARISFSSSLSFLSFIPSHISFWLTRSTCYVKCMKIIDSNERRDRKRNEQSKKKRKNNTHQKGDDEVQRNPIRLNMWSNFYILFFALSCFSFS